jgi:hypothetical protein
MFFMTDESLRHPSEFLSDQTQHFVGPHLSFCFYDEVKRTIDTAFKFVHNLV